VLQVDCRSGSSRSSDSALIGGRDGLHRSWATGKLCHRPVSKRARAERPEHHECAAVALLMLCSAALEVCTSWTTHAALAPTA
jgi:hypothetical protein